MTTRLGRVTRVTADGPYVELADVAAGFEFGPCLDTVGELAPGDRVIAQALARDEDELVITGRLGGSPGVTETELATALAGKAPAAVIPVKPVTDGPEAYPTGQSIMAVTSDPSWPDGIGFGTAITDHAGNINRVTQAYVAKTTSRTYRRTGDNSLPNGWSPWREVAMADTVAADLLVGAPRRFQLTNRAGTATYIRVAVIDGGSATGGTAVSFIAAGQGNYGSARRAITLGTFGQRGADVAWFEALNMGSTATPWTWFQKQISTYVFELWALRAPFENRVSVTDLTYQPGAVSQVTMDLESTANPGGLTALNPPTVIGGEWQDWTPAWTSGVTTGNGTWAGRYVRDGNTVQGWARFTLGSTSAVTGVPILTNPVAAVTSFLASDVQFVDSGSTYYKADLRYTNSGLTLYARGTNGAVTNISATVPFTWAPGDIIEVRFAYEAAPI